MVSQLKRLKASLHSAGITGQQKSKKANKRRSQSAGASDSRLDRNVALQSIRDEFNPFEVKTTREKHSVINQGRVKGKIGRPALSKSIGEENRRKTLLVEMQRRNKAGGLVDRRFGENDPTMAPEEKMLERFTREKQRRARGSALFNLEDDDDMLTHFGRSLGRATDDFDAQSGLQQEDDEDEFLVKSKKRRLASDEAGEQSEEESEEEEQPARKKSKNEVMKEVIAKSKLHKYERQKVKEADEDERERLDAQMSDLWALLGAKPPSTSDKKTGATGANSEPLPDREQVKDTKEAKRLGQSQLVVDDKQEGNYDQVVREMMFDKRSKPSDRTKTTEEKVAEESERLRELETARQKRMRGEESEDEDAADDHAPEGDDEYRGDAAEYGLGLGIPATAPQKVYDNPDAMLDGDYELSEDGYVDVDEDGVVDGAVSDYNSDSDYSGDNGSNDAGADSEDEEFLADLLTAGPRKDSTGAPGVLKISSSDTTSAGRDNKLAFTYPCPQSHKEMLEIVKDIAIEDLPTVVQRIRILHHPKLQPENKTKLANFSVVLLAHVVYVADLTAPKTPFAAVDTLIRHLHALAKSYPERVAEAFRDRLRTIHEKRIGSELTPGDLVLLTAVSTIFPTSDHFHPVVTPALIIICQWLAQTPPDSVQRLTMGTYLVTLCLQYQQLSKRYVPEALNYTLQGLCLLSPQPLQKLPGQFPYHAPEKPFRISRTVADWTPRRLAFSDSFDVKVDTPIALFHTLICLLEHFSSLYLGKNSFQEAFHPGLEVLSHLSSKSCKQHLPAAVNAKIAATHASLSSQLARAKLLRRPLELHHHRPLPIPSNIPKFEEGYNLDTRSYDHDSERREQAKLKAEYKRERKGAIRELRKDSRFVAREKLKEDKKTSQEYHAKMARLTQMVQTEEGAAKNEYERLKRARKTRK